MVAAAFAALTLAVQGPPQPRPSPLHLIAHGDSITVFLSEAPPPGGGFVVYRGPSGGALVRITPQPVTPARSAAEAAGVIGPDLVAVERTVQALGPVDMFRRLQSDPFAGSVLSALYPRVAVALGRAWVDTGVTRGAVLTYRIVFTDAGGHETWRRLEGAVQVVDQPPPSATSLASEVGDHLVTLSWAYPRGPQTVNVFAFVVYRADSSQAPFVRVSASPVLLSDTGRITYHDPTVTNGASYRYRVTALDVIGREGAPSEPLDVTPVDRTPPSFPADVATRVVANGVLVVWRLSPEPDAAGYVVERSLHFDGPFTRLKAALIPVDHPSYLDTAAVQGAEDYYRVVAVDRSGNESAPSATVEAAVDFRVPPEPPDSVWVVPDHHRLIVRWRRSTSHGVMGYVVYRGTPGETPTRLLRLPTTDTVYVDSGYGAKGLHPGGRYVVGVTAVDSGRTQSARKLVQVLVPDDEPPDPPTGLLARDIGGRYAEVAWSAPQAPDVASYDLQRAAAGSTFVTVAHVTGRPPFAVRDTGVVHGRLYVYHVVAVDSAGNRSAPADDTLPFTRPTPPPAPRHLAARATPGGVVLVWERVADAELAGYRVTRASLPTGEFTPLAGGLIHGTTFTDPAPVPGSYYRVEAVDTSGNLSAPSPAVRAGTGAS